MAHPSGWFCGGVLGTVPVPADHLQCCARSPGAVSRNDRGPGKRARAPRAEQHGCAGGMELAARGAVAPGRGVAVPHRGVGAGLDRPPPVGPRRPLDAALPAPRRLKAPSGRGGPTGLRWGRQRPLRGRAGHRPAVGGPVRLRRAGAGRERHRTQDRGAAHLPERPPTTGSAGSSSCAGRHGGHLVGRAVPPVTGNGAARGDGALHEVIYSGERKPSSHAGPAS